MNGAGTPAKVEMGESYYRITWHVLLWPYIEQGPLYSKYDLSCTLERQSSVACAGYIPEDAVRIAVNIVLYAMQQDIRFVEPDLE